MKWFEYQMEVDQLHAPDALKARLLAMQPDSQTSRNHSAPAQRGRAIRFPHWRRWAAGAAACAAVAVVGSQVLLGMGPAGAGISTMSMTAGGAASSTAAAYDAAAPEAAAYSLAENGLSARSAAGADSAVAGEKIIYTARLTLETKDYDAARAALEQALAAAGGWMESSSESTYDNRRSLSLTLRVPADSYEAFLTAAGETASVVNRSEQADDVTAQYTDVAGRIANLEGQRDRLRELQAGADTLADLLDIEAQLSDVQYQLESYTRQMRTLSGQVTYSTVDISLREVATLTPTATTFPGRLAEAFRGGWSGFVLFLQGLVLTLVYLWPLLLLAVIVVLVVRALARRHRVRHPRPPKPASPPSGPAAYGTPRAPSAPPTDDTKPKY